MVAGRPLNAATRPYKARAMLRRHRINAVDVLPRVRFKSGVRAGQPISDTTLSLMLCRDQWPKQLDRDEAKQAIEDYMRERGVPDAEIATAWEIDDAAGPLPELKERDRLAEREARRAPTDPFDLPEPEMLSIHAREYFSLHRHPFMDDVQNGSDVYLAKDQRYIRESMLQAAKHGGFIAVVGESGSGKSTLRRDLLERVATLSETITVIMPRVVDKAQMTMAHICDAIVADVSTESPKLSLEAKARQVERLLRDSSRTGNRHVLIIEEAHDLTVSTLKKLKRIWEIEDGFRKLCGVILIGQPELEALLDERRNYSAREVIRRCEVARLKPLNGNLEEYLALKFKRVDKKLDDVFEKDAFDAIRDRLTRRREGGKEIESHLYPLVVQILVVKAMNLAAELGVERIGADLVRRV